MLPVNGPGDEFSITAYVTYDMFDDIADPDGTLLVDLRPLRDELYSKRFEVADDARILIFGYDYALLIGGMSPDKHDRLMAAAKQSATLSP